MKTLIVATDFSKEAENSLIYACELARKLNAGIVLFNSFSLSVSSSNSLISASAFQELLDHNRSLLKAQSIKLSETYGIEVTIETGFMDFSRELDELIVKYDAALLVMGMASRSVEQDIFGNSTTATIMKLKYPVLAVPLESKFNGIKKILFAYDEIDNRELIEKIKNLAIALGATVEIFHVAKHIDAIDSEFKTVEAASVLEEVLKEVPHYYKNVESDKVVKVIEGEVLNIKADLLIMVPQKHGFLESIIHRSKTRIMASNNNVPLLSIPIV